MFYRDSSALTVDTITTSGISTSNDNVKLTTGGDLTINEAIAVGTADLLLDVSGNVTQTAAISGTGLLLMVDGTTTLNQPANDFDVFAADSNDQTLYTDTDDLDINSLTIDGMTAIGITTSDDDVKLTIGGNLSINESIGTGTGDLFIDVAGNVTQTTTITGAGLALTVDGTTTLTDNNNDFTTLAANNNGQTLFVDTDDLNVSSVTVDGMTVDGITTSDDDLTLCAESLTVSQDISVGAATIRLEANVGGVTQTGNSIAADALGVVAATAIDLSGAANTIGTFAANAGTSLTFINSTGFAIGTISAADCFSGATGLVAASDIDICLSNGDLIINEAIQATGQSVRLQADAGSVSQTAAGIITAQNLGVRAFSNVDLDQIANQIASVFAATSTNSGAIDFLNQTGFTIGEITASSCFTATTGVSTADGNITLTSTSGSMIGQETVIAGGTGDVDLSTTTSGDVRVHSVSAIGNTVTITAGGGDSIVEQGSDAASDITAATIHLTVSGAGQIGDVANRLELDAATVLNASTQGGDITTEDVAGGLTVGLIDASGGNVDLLVTSGSLFSEGSDSGVADVVGNHITLNVITTGNTIGTSAANPLEIDAVTLDASTAGLVGDNIFLSDLVGDLDTNLINAGAANLFLSTVGTLNEAGADVAADIVASEMELIAVTGIGNSAQLEIDASTLAAVTTSGEMDLRDIAGGLTVGNVGSTIGVSNTAGATSDDIVLSSLDGIVVNSEVANASGGNVRMTTDGVGTNINLNASVSSTGGHVSVIAQQSVTMSASGSVSTTANGTVDIEATTGAVTMAPASTVSSVNGDIRILADSDIAVGRVTASSANVSLISQSGDVLDADPNDLDVDISAIGLRIDAAIGVGTLGVGTNNALETDVDTITARAAAGGINLIESDSVIVDDVSTAIQRVNGVNGSTTITDTAQSDLRTTGGNGSIVLRARAGMITLNDGTATADSESISANGTGNVLVHTEAGAADIVINANVVSDTGHITVSSDDDILQNANVETTGGSIELIATNQIDDGPLADGLVMQPTAVLSSNGGNVRVAALNEGHARIGMIDAGIGAVSIQSEGHILDAGENTATNVVADVLQLIADSNSNGTGIVGGPDLANSVDANNHAIDTNVNTLAVRAGQSAYIQEVNGLVIEATGPVGISRVGLDAQTTFVNDASVADAETTASGSVKIVVSAGDLTVNDGDGDLLGVRAAAGGDVLLETRGSGGSVTVNSAVSTISGHFTIDALNDVAINASVTAGGTGTVFISAGNDQINGLAVDGVIMAGTSMITSGGDQWLQASGTANLVLRELDAGTNDVFLSAGGSILDGNGAATNIVAESAILIADSDSNLTGTVGTDHTTNGTPAANVNALDLQVTTVSASAAGGIYLLDTDGGVTVDSVTVGVERVNFNSSTSDLTHNQSDLTTTADGSIKLVTTNGTITVNDGDGSLDGIVAAADGDVLLEARGTGSEVVINSTVSSMTGSIGVIAHESVRITGTSEIRTGSDGTVFVLAGNDAVTITGQVVMAADASVITADGNIRLEADDDVVVGRVIAADASVVMVSHHSSIQDADFGDLETDITATGLKLNAAIGVGESGLGSNAIETAVDTVTARATSGGINLFEADAIVVDDVVVEVDRPEFNSTTSPITDVVQSDLITTAGNGAIVLRTATGSITLNDGSGAADGQSVAAHGTGNVLLDAGGAGSSLDANASISSSTGHIHAEAQDSMTLASGVMMSTNASGTIFAIAQDGSLTMDQNSSFNSANGDIQLQSAFDATIGDVIAASASVSIHSIAGSIVDADTMAGDIDIHANTAILNGAVGIGSTGDAIETTVGTMAARSGNGGIHLVETDALIVDDVAVTTNLVNTDGSATPNASLLQSDMRTTANGDIVVTTLSGSLTLNEGTAGFGDGAVFAAGTGDILLTSAGAGTNVIANADVTATSGAITVNAEQSVLVNAAATISTAGPGTIDIAAANGQMTMDATALVQSLDGDIEVQSNGTVTVGRIIAGNANVILTSQTGMITNADVASGDNDVTANDLTSSALNGIALDTAVGTLHAETTSAGNIDITELDAIELLDVDTADGRITVISGGHITATDVRSLTDTDANDIRLVSTMDGIHIGIVDAQTTGDVLLIAHGNVTQDLTGILTAEELGIRQQAATIGFVSLPGLNDVDVLAVVNLADGSSSSTIGNVTFFDIDDLLLDVVASDVINGIPFAETTGIDTNAGDINITADGLLNVTQNINAAHNSLTTSIDESISLISLNGDFVLADGLTISTDEDPSVGVFDDVTGDRLTIIAGAHGTNGHVDLGSNINIRTDGGNAKQIAPRPQAFITDPTAFVTMKDAADMRSSLSFAGDGFLGQLELIFGVLGEENLEAVIDWGAISLTDLTASGPAGDASPSVIVPGALEFGISDADKTIFYLDEGGREYVIPHIYEVGDLVTTPNDRNGRQNNPGIFGVRISVAQHESINVWGTSAADPTNPGNVEIPDAFTSDGLVDSVTDARGNIIGLPTSGLSLLSSTDTNPLRQFAQEASPLPFSNVVPTPTGTPEGLAEWEFIAGPSPGLVLVEPQERPVADIIPVEIPVELNIVADPFVGVDFGSGAVADAAIGTDVYLQIRRQFELDIDAEVVIPVIRDNGFISSREQFEMFVHENPELQDGSGYEIWLITETAGQKVERPIVRFEITGGQPGPATEELPDTFEPYELRELQFEQPEPDSATEQNLDDGTSQPMEDKASSEQQDDRKDSSVENRTTEGPRTSQNVHGDHAPDTDLSSADNQNTSSNRSGGVDGIVVSSAAVVSGSLARSARWRRKMNNDETSLSMPKRFSRRLRRPNQQSTQNEQRNN